MPNITEIYLAIFLLGYYLSYPTKVLLASTQASTLTAFTALGWAMLCYHGAKASISKSDFTMKSSHLFITFVLFAAAININIASAYHPAAPTLAANAGRYIIFFCACAPLMLTTHKEVDPKSRLIKSSIIAGSITYAIAAALNSSYRLPSDLSEPINEKYIVGPLLRAGAGYLDPNFLAINLIILLVISYHFSFGKIARYLITTTCMLGIFLTFSRAAWLVTAAIWIALTWRTQKTSFWLIAIGSFAAISSQFSDEITSENGLFRRFFDEEGSSSTADRFHQYSGALSEIFNASTEKLFFGMGGPDSFFQSYGSHLHNFYLGSFIDGGVLSTCLPIVALLSTFYISDRTSRWLLASWFSMSLFLPDVPDTLFLAVSLALTLNNSAAPKVQSLTTLKPTPPIDSMDI